MAPVPEEKDQQKKKIQIKVGNENIAIVCNSGQLNNGQLNSEQLVALQRALALAKQRRSSGYGVTSVQNTVKPVQASNDDVKPEIVKKKVVTTPQTPQTPQTEESPQEEIRDFIVKYSDKKSGKGKKELSVKDLRHIIPLLIMHTYSVKEEPAQKKVKGIWNERPKGWPDHLPYCDPNNAVKEGNGKPKKEILMQMCDFLVQQFNDKIGETNGGHSEECEVAMSVDVSPPQQHSVQVKAQLSPDKNSITRQVEQVNLSAPIEVSEEDMMDPAAEILERNRKKLAHLKSKAYLGEADSGLLSIIADLLNKMYLVRTKGEEFFLQTSHDLELTFDLTIRQKRLPDRYRQKWKEFEENVPSYHEQIDEVLMQQEKEAVMEENEVEDEVEVLNVVNEEEVETTEIEVPNEVVQLIAGDHFNLDGVDFQDLGIQQITLSDVNELAAQGLLEMRIVSSDEDSVQDEKEREITEEEIAKEKLKYLLSEKSLVSLSPQKSDVSTVIEVPYGTQNEVNKATRPHPFNGFGQQPQAEHQQLRALLSEPSARIAPKGPAPLGPPAFKYDSDYPALKYDSDYGNSADDEMRKMVMAMNDEGLLLAKDAPTTKMDMGDLGVVYMEDTGGADIEMEIDDFLALMESDKPAPVPITVSEIADTGPTVKRQSSRGKSRLKKQLKTKY